jgi:MFS family permease
MRSIAKEYFSISKIIQKDAWNYLIGNFFAGFGFTGFSLLFNLYLKASGRGEGSIGNILSVGTYATVLMIFPAAYIVKRISIKPVLIIIPLVMSAGYSIAIEADSLRMIMTGIALSGFAGSFGSVIGGPLLMQSSGEAERTHLFSINHAIALLSGITGNLAAGSLPDLMEKMGAEISTGYKFAIFVHLIIALVSIYFYSKIEVSNITNSDPDISNQKRFNLKTSKKLLAYLAIPPMVVGMGAGMTIPFLNLYFKTRFELSANNIGMLFALAQFFTIGGALLAPVLARKLGKIKMVIAAQMLSLPFLLMLGVSYYLPVAVAAFLIRNALMNMTAPISSNFSMEAVHPDDRSITSGLLSLAWLFTWGITANVGGYLIEKTGDYIIPFAFTMLFYILSSYLYYKLLLPVERNKASEDEKMKENDKFI